MRIRIDGEMLSAMRAGEDTYTPVVGSEELDLEHGDPVTTVKNLRRLVDMGRRAIGFCAGHGNVLIMFDSGESYLATGFSYGHRLDEVQRFAEFASSQGFGDARFLYDVFSGLPPEYEGPIQIVPQPHGRGRRTVETVPHPALDE